MIDKQNKLPNLSISFCLSLLLLSGCASTNGSIVSKNDPYEEINRSIFYFNEELDNYLGKPVSSAYDFIAPDIIQTGIGNFFNNLKEINVILNDLMQGKLLQAGEDTGRFLLNTSVGLGGLFDVANEIGLKQHNEDFAQTLAIWGVPKGPYLVLPIFGSATSRGIPGLVFDTAMNPATYAPIPIRTLELLNLRANAKGLFKIVDEGALDPYLFIRESFLQSRQHLITDGQSELIDELEIDKSNEISKNSIELKHATDSLNTTERLLEKTNSSFKNLSKKIDQLKLRRY